MEKQHETKEIVKHKNDFLVYLEEKLERSPKTLENYDRYLHQFLIFSNVKVPKDIDIEIVDLFKKWLKNKRIYRTHVDDKGKTLSKKTQNYYLISLRAFLKYLREVNITSLDPNEVTLVQYERTEPEFLEDETIEKIITSFTKNDIKSVRDKAIFLTLLSTGVRVSELCALNKKDVHDTHILVTGKKETKRNIPIPPEVKDVIEQYGNMRRDLDEALFVNNGKRVSFDRSIRLTPRSIQRIIQQCTLQAGVAENISPHILRHTYAHKRVAEGKSREELKLLLGHEEILSSHIYK